jgi:hypothetical protein
MLQKQREGEGGVASGDVAASVTQATPASVEQSKLQTGNQGVVCPRCHQVAPVQKVSAIVSAGVSNIQLAGATVGASYDLTGSGGLALGAAHTKLAGNQQSLLAQRLAPPVKPVAKFQGFTYFFTAIIMIPIAILIGGLANAKVGPVVFVIGMLFYTCVKAYKEWKAAEDCKLIAVPAWERHMAQWNGLYYCHHCDHTFTPREESTDLSPTASRPPNALSPSPLPIRMGADQTRS